MNIWGTDTSTTRRSRVLVVTLLSLVASSVASLVGLAVLADEAAAHAGIDSSIPAASSVLIEAPESIVLDFDEPVESSLADIRLFDETTEPIELGVPEAVGGDGSVVSASVPDLDDGTYAVVWRITSLDGHVIDGAFSFQIGTGSSGGTDLVDRLSGESSGDPTVGLTTDIARFVAFVGLVLLIGAGLFAAMAPARLGGSPSARRVIVAGLVLTVVAAAAAFGLYAAAAVGGTMTDTVSPDAWSKVAGTRTGRFLLARLALSLLAVGVVAAARKRATSWWQSVAVALSIALIMTFPAAGHPSAATPAALWQVLDGVHLAFIVVWLGGLALFTAGGRAWLADAEAEPVVRRFSATATVAVPVIVVTGAFQAVELAGGIDALTDTDWGRRLLVKVSIVTVLVALGAVSRWVLRASGPGSLRRTVVAEAAVGLVVLGVTAGMLDLPPVPPSRSQVVSTTVTEAGVLADITVTPGRVGANEIHIVLTPPGGSLTPISNTTARVALPERDLPAAPVDLSLIGANHYTGTVTFPYSGEWRLDLIVEVTPGNTVLLRTDVPIP